MDTPVPSSPDPDAVCYFHREATDKLGLPNFGLTGAGFRKLMGPGIYIVWSMTECLYVGMAKNLLHRLSRHNVLPGIMADIFEISLVSCKGEEQARDMESFAIAVFQPTLNKVIPKAYVGLVKPVGK